jgi:hypothetical protein
MQITGETSVTSLSDCVFEVPAEGPNFYDPHLGVGHQKDLHLHQWEFLLLFCYSDHGLHRIHDLDLLTEPQDMEEEHHGMEEGLMKMQRNLLELAGTACASKCA